MRIAGTIASLLGACAGLVIMRYVNHFAPVWNQFVSDHIVHAKTLSSATAKGPASYRPPPIWVQFIMVVPPLAALLIACVGVSVSLYRCLRGERLPEVGDHTRCGRCQHELRGITIPVCSECGHRIGDDGPDEHGVVPLVQQRGYRLRVLMMLHVTFLVAAAAFATVGGLILKLVIRDASSLIGETIVMFATFFLALKATIGFYEASAQYDLTHCGRSWCRICKGELRNLSDSICPACGSRI